MDVAEQAYLPSAQRKTQLGDLAYDPLLSDDHTAIYRNDRQIKVGFSGTRLSSTRHRTSDLLADLALWRGDFALHPRYVQARQKVERLRQQFPQHELVTTGHSLGGSIAQYAIAKLPDDGRTYDVTYNAGATPWQQRVHPKTKSQRYHVRGDPWSFPSLFDTSVRWVNKKEGAGDPHTLANFKT